MARADDYRRYAAECLLLAQRADNPHDRTRLLEMASAWNDMAAKAMARAASESEPAEQPASKQAEESALPWKPRE